jgi:hypothetical protein
MVRARLEIRDVTEEFGFHTGSLSLVGRGPVDGKGFLLEGRFCPKRAGALPC